MPIESHTGTYIIAEISANHGNCLEKAKRLIEASRDIGVDAVKFQSFTADSMTLDIDRDEFKIKNEDSPWYGKRLYDLYKESALPYEWHNELFEYARQAGLDPISTAFCKESTDLIVSAGASAIKIASAELVDIDLIRYAARQGLPLILSTGMSTLGEIAEAVDVAKSSGCLDITLLKCTTSYPANPKEANLRTIGNLKETFETRVGLSDHTLGSAVAVAAVALGATVVEKHITLSREKKTNDSHFSMEPEEFERLVGDIRVAESALGRVHYGPVKSKIASRGRRRSLYFSSDIEAGGVVSMKDIKAIRPGSGLNTRYKDIIAGMRTTRAVKAGDPVSWEFFRS